MRISELSPNLVLLIMRRIAAPANMDLYCLKNAVQLLGVCHAWRDVVRPYLYSHIYFVAHPVNGKEEALNATFTKYIATVDVVSNIALIKVNGRYEDVEHFHYINPTTRYIIPPLLYMIKEFAPNANEFPHIGAIEPAARSTGMHAAFVMVGHNRNVCKFDPEQDLSDSLRGALHRAGPLIKHRLPNVNALQINACHLSASAIEALSSLVDCYQDQLAILRTNVSQALNARQSFPVPIVIDLSLKGIDTNSIPLVYPSLLSQATLHVGEAAFDWRCFHFDKQSNHIEFQNLRALWLQGDTPGFIGFGSPLPLPIELGDVQLAFPALTRLHLCRVPICPGACQSLMGAPLKSLHFEGALSDVLMLTQYRLNKLADVSISLVFGRGWSPDSHFIEQSNKLISRIRGIKMVELILQVRQFTIDATKLDWMGITHFELTAPPHMQTIFQVVAAIPTLKCLSLYVIFPRMQSQMEALTWLKSMQQRSLEPSSSAITTLKLAYDCRGLSPVLGLIERQFRCYLPRLRNVIRRGVIFTYFNGRADHFQYSSVY